jgi:mono/diheme cytochrome c family protein
MFTSMRKALPLPKPSAFPGGRLVLLALAVLLVALLGAACGRGSYPIDFFYEMHYQRSFHQQEPPRLAPPDGAVPTTGREVFLTPETLEGVTNPIPGQGIEHGALLYAINCSMCHGATGLGDGQVLNTMIQKYGYTPKLSPNLQAVRALPDSFLYGIISIRDLILTDPNQPKVMPRFQHLLTPEERWMIINYLREGLPNP